MAGGVGVSVQKAPRRSESGHIIIIVIIIIIIITIIIIIISLVY